MSLGEPTRDYLRELSDAAKKRDVAGEHYAKKAARVRDLIREAQAAGVPMTHLARAAGISRVRAYTLLHKAGGFAPPAPPPPVRDELRVEGLD